MAASRCLSRSIGQPKLQIAAPFAVQVRQADLIWFLLHLLTEYVCIDVFNQS